MPLPVLDDLSDDLPVARKYFIRTHHKKPTDKPRTMATDQQEVPPQLEDDAAPAVAEIPENAVNHASQGWQASPEKVVGTARSSGEDSVAAVVVASPEAEGVAASQLEKARNETSKKCVMDCAFCFVKFGPIITSHRGQGSRLREQTHSGFSDLFQCQFCESLFHLNCLRTNLQLDCTNLQPECPHCGNPLNMLWVNDAFRLSSLHRTFCENSRLFDEEKRRHEKELAVTSAALTEAKKLHYNELAEAKKLHDKELADAYKLHYNELVEAKKLHDQKLAETSAALTKQIDDAQQAHAETKHLLDQTNVHLELQIAANLNPPPNVRAAEVTSCTLCWDDCGFRSGKGLFLCGNCEKCFHLDCIIQLPRPDECPYGEWQS